MNLLSIESATPACSIALTVDGQRLERSGFGARIHAGVLVPWVGELLSEAGIGPGELDAIAVDRGPGGFTSLRLGLGVAQGIALAHDLPVHPVSSLAALARGVWPHGDSGRVLVAIDARMGEVYAAWFDLDATGHPALRGEEMLLAPGTLDTRGETAFIAAGSALAVHARALEPVLAAAGRTFPDVWPTARAVAELAGRVEPVPAHRLELVYLRDKVTG